jgi:hypothetical protein
MQYMCPYCERTFRLELAREIKQLLVAVDVSTSVAPFLADIQRELSLLRDSRCENGGYRMSTVTFHNDVCPFPCEKLGEPLSSEYAVVPTLRDLRGRLAPGSAIVDTLYRLLATAEVSEAAVRELVVMTDGKDRGSRRHPEELRRRIARASSGTSIHIQGFVGSTNGGSLFRFVRRLRAPRVMWSLHTSNPQDSVRRVLVFPQSSSESLNRGQASCC